MGTKTVFVVVAHLAMICCACSPVHAQGVRNYGFLTGLPSLVSRGDSSSGPESGASCIFPGLGRCVLNVGYANLRADASFNQENNPLLLGIRHKYIIYGVWYEVLQQIFLTDKIGVMAIANYLQPTSERLEEDAEFVGGFHARRTWATSTQLWGLGGALTYNVSNSLTVIGGLNWGAFDLTFREITADSGGQGFVRPKSQVAVRFWTPFLGLALTQQSSRSILNLGVIACPAFDGKLDYQLAGVQIGSASGAFGNFYNSQFITLNADYAMKILGGAATIGVLGRYTIIPAGFGLTVEPGPGPPPLGDPNVQLRANAQLWVVGATASFHFVSPI